MKLYQLLTVMIFAISCGQQGSLSSYHDSKISYKSPDNPPSRTAAKPIDSKKEADDYSPPKSAQQKTETIIGIAVSLGIAGLIFWEVVKAHGEIHTSFNDIHTSFKKTTAIKKEIEEIKARSKRESDEYSNYLEKIQRDSDEYSNYLEKIQREYHENLEVINGIRESWDQLCEDKMIALKAKSENLKKEIEKAKEEGREEDAHKLWHEYTNNISELVNLANEKLKKDAENTKQSTEAWDAYLKNMVTARPW